MLKRKNSVCYINPTIIFKRPISEIISKLPEDYEIGFFVPKPLFKKLHTKTHYSELIKKAKVYYYSTITIPFINFEWPIPITPMFFIHMFRIFKKYETVHMWTFFYLSNFFSCLWKALFFPKKKLICTCDTFPGYSFIAGKTTDTLFRIYCSVFKGLIFGVPDIMTLYGQSLVKYAIQAGVSRKIIRVISTGVNIKKYSKRLAPKIRKEFNIKKNEFFVLFVGMLVPRKGIDKIIKVADKLKKENIKFVLVGGGPSEDRYKKMVSDLKLNEKVIFVGWRKDVQNFYNEADLFFLPAIGEGLPGVVMEASACSLPSVSTKIPCTIDLVIDRKTGYLCSIDDINCFAKRIKELAYNRKKLKEFSKRTLQHIKKFDWDSVMKKYLALYE